MKRFGYIVAVTLFAIFAIADIVHKFVTNDPIRYFSSQPHQLLVVAAIAILGGIITFLFCRLSPNGQRKVKLITLGSVASCMTVGGAYFGYQFTRISVFSGHTLALALLAVGLVAALFWLEFYQIFRSRAS